MCMICIVSVQNVDRERCMQNIYHANLSLFALPLPSCSKYRPQSTEPQTDGLSVSTTADGSQPNVRKLCDTPPPAPQAHTHNLAYYDNIICQVRPNASSCLFSFFSPSIHLLRLTPSVPSSTSTISSLVVLSSIYFPLCS